MDQTDSGTDFVDILTTVASGSASSNFDLVGVYDNISGINLGNDNNGSGGGLNSTTFFSNRNSLNPMSSGFVLELTKSIKSGDFYDIVINLGYLPSDFVSVAKIHVE